MAPAKDRKPSVEYRHDDGRGEHQIGAVIDGAFIPFARVHDSQAAQLAENASNRQDTDEADGKGGE